MRHGREALKPFLLPLFTKPILLGLLRARNEQGLLRRRTTFQAFIRHVRRGNSDVQQGDFAIPLATHATHTGNPRDKPKCLEGICKSEMWVYPAAITGFEPECAGPVATTVVIGKRRLLLRSPKKTNSFWPCQMSSNAGETVSRPALRWPVHNGCGFWRHNDVCRTVRKTRAAPTLLCSTLVVASCCFTAKEIAQCSVSSHSVVFSQGSIASIVLRAMPIYLEL